MDHLTGSPKCEQIGRFVGSSFFFVLLFLCATVTAEAGTGTTSSQTLLITAEVASPDAGNNDTGNTGSGNGASSIPPPNSNEGALFKGRAYPFSIVSLLQNGVIVSEDVAGQDGRFEIRLQNIGAGTYTFGFRAQDENHLVSTLDTYTVSLSLGSVTTVDGIFLGPTIGISQDVLKKGEKAVVKGKAIPNSLVTILIQSGAAPSVTRYTLANQNGDWRYTLKISSFGEKIYAVKAKSNLDNLVSSFSSPVSVGVDPSTQKKDTKDTETICPSSGKVVSTSDLNCDNRINLLDVSMMVFWYRKPGFPPSSDLNQDGKINLIDFSMMIYHWTG